MHNRIRAFYIDLARSYYGPERYARRLKSSPGQLSLFDRPQTGQPVNAQFEQVHPRAVKGAPGGGRFVDKPGTAKQPLEPATKAKPLPKSGVESFDKDRDERAKLKADIEAGKDIPDHAFGRHNDLRELAENRRRQRAFAGEEEPAFHAMTKAEYQAYVESISPLPSDYFKIGDIPVVQNPTTDDYRAMSKQVREEFPNMPADTPKVRSTYDKRGNQWIWPAHKALHQHVEPDIERRVKAKVNQAFEIPKHSEYIRDALRQGLEIPRRVQAEYPQYAEFFSGKTKYDIGASKVMLTTETPGIETVPQQYFLQQVAMAYYGPERYAQQRSLFDMPERPAGAPEWTPPKPKQKTLLGTGQTGGAPGDEPAPNWVRMQGDRGATYWYNRVTNPNNLPDGRLYQISPPTKAQERSASPPRRAPEPAPKPDYKSPEPQPTLKVHNPELEKRELTEIRGLINAGQKIPPALARKHAEAVKEIMAEKQADIQAKVDKERQWVKQALSEGRQISPALRNRHPDLVKIAESQRQQRIAASAEHRAQQVKPRAVHKPPEERLKPPPPTRSNVFTAVPRWGHVAITEYPGKMFKYKITNANPTNIPPHHEVLETRLVEENNELFRVSLVETSHGKHYSHIEVADILDSQPGRLTIEFRPATPAETKVIASKSDKQSPVAALEREMWNERPYYGPHKPTPLSPEHAAIIESMPPEERLQVPGYKPPPPMLFDKPAVRDETQSNRPLVPSVVKPTAKPPAPDKPHEKHDLRIQRKRTAGYKLPPDAVVVTRPTVFGNPFKVEPGETSHRAVAEFRNWLLGERKSDTPEMEQQRQAILKNLPKLKGKQLACFCPEHQPCHADVLAELANRPEVRSPDESRKTLFAQALAFAEAVCEKYAPRWNKAAPGFRKKGRPSPGQKSFDFAADEHASILRQWEFEDEVKHPRGGDGRWVKKHGPEQSDKPAPLFEHEKIDDASDLFRDEQGNLQQPDAAAVERAVGKQWIDHATAEQIMVKLGVSKPSEQIKQLFYDQDMKRVNPTMPTRRFAATVASLTPKQVPVNPDYEPLKRLFYDEDGDAVLPHRGDVEKVLGPSINRKGATEAMRAIGLNDKPTMQRVLNGTFTRKGQTHETQESEWFAFRLFHELHQHIKQQRWQELASQVPGDATVIVFAKQSDPHEKLILHPSTYKRGMWQLSRRDKDGPVMHSDHKTREEGLRAAIGVSEKRLDDEGDASYKLLWHNKSGTKAPFSLRTSKLRGAAVELYSQVAMKLYGPERYAKQLSPFEPAQPAAGKPKDPTHALKHPHLPGGTREGGRFAPKPKVPEVDPAEGMTAEERRNYYHELGKQARKRTKKWDPNRPVSDAQREVNEVAEDIYNAANAGEYVSQPARDKFSKQIGGYVRRKVAKSGLQKSDQDDAAQDIFLKVWDKLTDPNAAGRWDPSKGNFTRWLGGVVARAISDQVAFAEMRQGREQRGKTIASALDVEGEGDDNLSFVSQIADREYRAAFKPETMNRLLDRVFAKQLPGLRQPSEIRAAELYFGIRAPNDKPMEGIFEIAKQIVREKIQRYNPHMTPAEVQHQLDSKQSEAGIDKLRRFVISNKAGTGTLDPGGPLFRGFLSVAEQEKIGLEDFYEDPIRSMMEEQYTLASAEQYTLAYMLYKHRRHVHDFLRQPERYILAEMGTTPERYTRPFDETQVVRGQKGDPRGQGGMFQPKHGAAPAGTQGVQAAQAPGSMTTATPSAAPSVPKLLPSQPHQPQTGTTAKTAVALALLAAGVLGGKKTMGMGLLASAAIPHLTKTMQTQAKQARSVLKQNPHSDFGKQLAESARKIDAKLKAAEATEKKQQEAEQKQLSKRIDAALKKERQKQKTELLKLGRKRLSRGEQREKRLSDREARLRAKEDRLQQGKPAGQRGSGSRKNKSIEAIEDKLKEKVVTELQQSPADLSGFKGKVGSDTTIRVHNRQPLQAKYGVMDLKDVQASHNYFTGVARPNESYPAELQPREYVTGNDNDAKIRDHAGKTTGQEPRYYVSDAPDAVNGPPVLGKNGFVINGNGRVHSLQLSAAQGDYSWYKDALARDADKFGLDANEIAGMEHPVLVRLTGLDESTPDASEFARSGNIAPTQSENISRTGAGLNYLITDDTLNSMNIPDDSTLSDVLSKDSKSPLVREIWDKMPSSEKSRYFTDNRRLTAQGKDLVSEMLLSKFVPAETLERMGEEHRSLKRGLEAAVPQLLKLGKSSGIRDSVNEAIGYMVRHPDDKSPNLVDQTLRQKPLDPTEKTTINPQARMLLDFFLTSKDTGGSINSRKVREGMTRLVRAMDDRTKTLLGEHPLPEHEHAADALGVTPREGASFSKRKQPVSQKMSLRYWNARRELYTQLSAAYYGGKA